MNWKKKRYGEIKVGSIVRDISGNAQGLPFGKVLRTYYDNGVLKFYCNWAKTLEGVKNMQFIGRNTLIRKDLEKIE